jgi:Protein of unknown function (DUF1207)
MRLPGCASAVPMSLGAAVAAVVMTMTGGTARAESDLNLLVGGVGSPIFEHLRADLLDPHFGMRVYWGHQVPGTLHAIPDPAGPDANARAATPNGNHFFWDVSFGERVPLVGWYDVEASSPERVRGVVLNLVAAAYVLVDLSAQSSAVLDTDYRIGGSIDGRPWWPGWDHLSVSLGYFHQSSHLGDEYVLSAPTIQSVVTAPQVNPFLPYRANPAVQAFPMVLSLDLPAIDAVRSRVYGGATVFADSVLPAPPEYRAGAEVRWAPPALAHSNAVTFVGGGAGSSVRHRRTLDFMLAYDILLQRRYDHLGPEPGPPVFETLSGYWATSHAMLMALYNLGVERSTTNAVGLSIELLWGRVQHGQLLQYATVGTVAASLSYYL